MRKILLILLFFIIVSQHAFAEEFEADIPLIFPEKFPLSIPDFSPFDGSEKIKTDIPRESHKVTSEETTNTIAKDTGTLADKAMWINLFQDDEEKIKEWAKIRLSKNYLIINKKDCSAVVYDKDGNELKSFEIGIGREIGDDFNDTSGLTGKAKNTTPAGEFTLTTNIFNKAAYGDLTLSLGSKANKSKKSGKMVALHKVPKFRQERLCKFKDGNLSNNRMSHGCINFLEKDFKELTKYIHGGFKVYILPEEKDNKLMLVKNDKGEFEFVQTKY